MEKLESIAFLALCLGVPVAMGAILVWRLWVWLRDRRAVRRMEREGDWTPSDARTIEATLDGTGIAIGRRIEISDARRQGELLVAHHRHRRRKGVPAELRQSTARRLLLVPRDGGGPIGVVQAREGGVLESAALGAAAILTGARPREVPGWEWAIVAGSGDWLPPSASEPVRALLRPGERLHLGRTHAVLSLPDGEMAPLMEEAAARARAVRDAIAPASPPPAV